jgi:hypothetical protein
VLSELLRAMFDVGYYPSNTPRPAEVQALLDDHIAGGKHSAADVIAKAQAVLSEAELLRAMFDVGYFTRTRRLGATNYGDCQKFKICYYSR